MDNFTDFDILCFTETHLDHNISNDALFLSDIFDEPYRKDRSNHGGGVMVYLNSNLIHSRRADLEVYCEESIWVEVKVNHVNYLLGVFYSPRTADFDFFHSLNLNLEEALDISKNLIILGDLNEDLLNSNFHNLKDLITINSLQNIIHESTRQQAILDPILIPDDMPYLDSGVLETPNVISDHNATFVRISFHYSCQATFKRLVWLYRNADFQQLKALISNYDWSVLAEGSVNDACVKFTDVFLEFVRLCIPSKVVTVRPNDKPWFDSDIRHFIRIRNKLRKKSIKSGNTDHWLKFKQMRNKVNNLKKHAKEKFYNNLEISLSDFQNNDKKKFWQVIRHFVKNNSNSGNIPPLLNSGQNVYCVTDSEKAECLNNYFSSICDLDDNNAHLPVFRTVTDSSLSDIICTPDEITDLILILNPNKATGPDAISNRMLKAVAREVSIPLSIIFNRSFSEGCFAEIWKTSNVLPLYKKGDKSVLSNYRPISLLSGVSKLQERIVHKNMYNFLLEHNLLYKYQSGFLPHHSTTFQLIDIYQHICQTFDNNQFSCMVFCDVSKAFDRVWHKGLIFKLKQHGINGSLLNWIDDYLSNRKQKVVIRSCTSSSRGIHAGVPQGSVLGPLLFLIYVNDISDSLLSLTRLFADDSSLFCAASSIADIEGIINHDLLILSRWAKQWLITFNPLKTEAVLFTLKKFENYPQILFDNTPIKFVENHKHLGLTFSNNGQWHKHIENIITSASKVIGIMRKLKYTFNRFSLNQIYISYVLPILEYSSIVWDGCTVQDRQTLEKIQNEAARVVTGLTRSVSLENLYRECGWVPLFERRTLQKMVFMYKINNDIVPPYITDLIPPLVREVSNYPLRNSSNVTVPYTRTEISKKSCIPSSISLWNSLDDNVRSAGSVSAFKQQLKKHASRNSKVPVYFISGERFPSVMHARIRNKCSNLKGDLYLNHLSPTQCCSCSDVVEDAEHFFFNCPNFLTERVMMFQTTRTFHPLSLNKILFGDISLTDSENKLIFNAVQKFIKDTKRFNISS
ncbi:MAG: hypothetical protein JAZ17_16505 [Candidatus Thiodiazotropha endolucinida]|nr:hypothetical protein [Candidatus Thiodiazotropha endolucinida]